MTISAFYLFQILLYGMLFSCDESTDPAPEVEIADTDVAQDTNSDEQDSDAQEDPDAQEDVSEIQSFLSVGTFNLKLFFDTTCQSNSCDERDFENLPTSEEFAARADEIALGIQELEADVVLIQEIENQTCLDALTERLGERFPTAVIGETGFSASIDVAVLATGDLIEVVTHRENRIPLESGAMTSFARELLEVHLDYDGQRVIVFSAHFISYVSDPDGDRRLAEANATHRIMLDVVSRYPEALIIMGGDINDSINTQPQLALEGDGIERVGRELGGREATTYYLNGEGLILDQLYVARPRGIYLEGTARVVTTTPRGLRGSDHAGFRAEFGLQ